jgi:hypothetical protein
MGSTTNRTNIEVDHIKFLIVSCVLSMTIAVISILPYHYMGKGANCFFYSMQSITFVVTFKKREYPVNFSLESLKDQLHPDNFFEINRQFIVNIDAIKRVHSYFNGKLKLEIKPSHAEDIIVGKDKASAFKPWMDR